MRDSDALGLACAAWAFASKPTPANEVWLIARRDRRQPLGDAEVVVTAFVAAARGDADTARAMLRSLEQIVEVHPAVRELAGEWLACDAAERGAWDELAADAAAARWPATSLSYFLEGVATRRANAPIAPAAADLYARWLLAPHRRATRGLLGAEPAVTVDRDPDACHRELARAVQEWDALLADPAIHAWLARRAVELDAPEGAVDRAVHDVATAVTEELARAAERDGLPASDSRGVVGGALARKLRHGRLDALEAGFSRWAERRTVTRGSSERAPIDEWREWCALRGAYEGAVTAGGLELRRLAFPHAYTCGTQMAAWLWNARREYALSHAISTWLLGEALAVGDAEAIDLCTRNTRLAVPTRTGVVKG
jgi:hypothetical protein